MVEEQIIDQSIGQKSNDNNFVNNKPSMPKKEKTNKLGDGIKEFFLSFIYVFVLAYRGVTYPITLLFNALGKSADDAFRKASSVARGKSGNVMVDKPVKEDPLEKFIRNIKNSLGITQKEIEKLEDERYKLQQELASPEAKRTTEAKVYIYKVKDKNGKISKGKFTGFSKLDVNSFLLNEGYEVYSIENNKWIDFIYGESAFISKKWNNKDLIFWLTQLSTYIKSGIPLAESIKILMNQMGKDKSKKVTMQSIAYELTMGNTFSGALEKQAGIFPPLLINMLKAAEATGELEETLDDMANYYSEMESTRKQMISAMTYPTIIMIFALGVVVFIIMYVLPKFRSIYDSSNITITGITAFLLNFSDFLKKYIGFIILIIMIVVLVFYFAYKKIKAFRRTVQVIMMKLPVIGNIIIYNEITIFTKTFASLLKNNVFITESIDILSKITNNEIYKEIMFDTINNIAKGDRISKSFKDHWAVPDVAYYMIVTGESTGELAQMLSRVSTYYQEQHRSLINSLKSLLEPIVIAVLAIVVGGILLSVIVPMFQMYEQIS